MKNKNLKKYFSLFFALLCFVQGMIALPDASAQISRQPYLQKLTTSSVLVAWRSSSSQAFELRYGSTPNMLTNSLTSPASTEHGVDIVGLAAYTQYFYQILMPTEMHLAKPNIFIPQNQIPKKMPICWCLATVV